LAPQPFLPRTKGLPEIKSLDPANSLATLLGSFPMEGPRPGASFGGGTFFPIPQQQPGLGSRLGGAIEHGGVTIVVSPLFEMPRVFPNFTLMGTVPHMGNLQKARVGAEMSSSEGLGGEDWRTHGWSP